jgi:hypothetical protein
MMEAPVRSAMRACTAARVPEAVLIMTCVMAPACFARHSRTA